MSEITHSLETRVTLLEDRMVRGFTSIEEKLSDLKHLLDGNGKPGLVQRVSDLEAYRTTILGGWRFIGILCTVVAGTTGAVVAMLNLVNHWK